MAIGILYRESSTPLPSEYTRTRVIPLPSTSVPLSRCIESIAAELEEYQIDTSSLYQISRTLDCLTAEVADARSNGRMSVIPSLLEKAGETMRDAIMTMKMIGMMERSRFPVCTIDHLNRIRQHTEKTYTETIDLLKAFEYPSSDR